MFFSSWAALERTAVVGVLAYVALVFLLRVSGKRTLSKMNAFDFVVTVALGSTLATILLSKDVSLAQGVFAFALLITLQYVIAWLSVWSQAVSNLVKAEPTLLLYQGTFCHDRLRQERVTEGEVRAAVRAHGSATLADIAAVVLETNGSFTVIIGAQRDGASALADVTGLPPESAFAAPVKVKE